MITSLTLAGCPLTLEDDFKIAPPGSGASASAGDAGQGNRGGKAIATAGNGAAAGETMLAPGGDGGSSPVVPDAGAGGLGEGGAPVVPPCADCSPEECCNGQCVNLELNPQHCSECNKGCPGTTCDNASCTNTCAQGFLDCNHNVVDGCEINPAIDPQNCGNCEVDCGFQFECQAGYCVCPDGTADCDGNKDNGCETDTTSDSSSCGGCGKACGANQACANRICGCEVGFDDCNGLPDDGCEADLTANGTCGSCDLDCGPYSACVREGQCDCVPTHLECDDQIAGCETPITDPTHCGDCDISCPAQSPVCDGVTCVDGCNGLTRCGDSCVDVLVDPANCGDCGETVGLNQICEDGQPACVGGYDDCDADPTSCETNTQTDVENCGACGDPCKSGAVCSAGMCNCAPSTPNDCGASCEQCCDATQCSDGDLCTVNTCSSGVCSFGAKCEAGGNCCSGTGCFECCSDGDCAAGKMCSSNQCVNLVCTPPQVVCNLACVNPETDANNCGACGNHCGPGRTCSGSTCTPKWVPTAAAPASFVSREKAAFTAMGSKVFIWGGNNAAGQALNDGAIYDPTTDTWTAVGTTGSPPSGRVLATAVWTGSVVVVWAGGDVGSTADYSTGSRYDPATDTWQAITSFGAPPSRRAPHGFWTGSRVMFYGGLNSQGVPLGALYLYDPVNDVWSSTTSNDRPSALLDRTVGWSGSLLTVYGGRQQGGSGDNKTYTYELATDDWANVADGPTDRYGALGTWDGTYLLAWSGMGSSIRTNGRMYNPVDDTWTNMGTAGDPTYRYAIHRMTGWTNRLKPRVTLMVGGFNSSNGVLTDGGIYNSTTNGWTPVTGWPSAASHLWGVGVWTGTELVMWSGRLGTSSTLTTAGDRYVP
ncbi:MAG TPA: kelch repeat-containing protein [Polyangiaceae bacterium]|nr:kelch repeat-containing protein [Polyangiaceae bacterium]